MRSLPFLLMTVLLPMSLAVTIPVFLIPHCDTLQGYNKTNSTLSTGQAQTCLTNSVLPEKIFTVLLLPIMLVPLIGMFKFLLSDDDNEEEQKKLLKQVETEIPNAEQLSKIPCALCHNNVDRPYNLIKHLGIEQTKQYLSFCDESKTEPTLYCCKCYAMVEKNPHWQKAFDDSIDNQIKTNELRKLWEAKIKA